MKYAKILFKTEGKDTKFKNRKLYSIYKFPIFKFDMKMCQVFIKISWIKTALS